MKLKDKKKEFEKLYWNNVGEAGLSHELWQFFEKAIKDEREEVIKEIYNAVYGDKKLTTMTDSKGNTWIRIDKLLEISKSTTKE